MIDILSIASKLDGKDVRHVVDLTDVVHIVVGGPVVAGDVLPQSVVQNSAKCIFKAKQRFGCSF